MEWNVSMLKLLVTSRWLLCVFAILGALDTRASTTVAQENRQALQPQTELVILDSRLPNARWLQQQVRPGVDVVLLDTQREPLRQLRAILAARQPLTALHLVTHGAPGSLQLGATRLDGAQLQQHPELLQALTTALVPHGDLLLYGCDVAAGTAGQSFIKTLRQQTGLNIAASDNLTGSSALGGDWILERQQGRRHVGLAFQPVALQAYSQVLVAPSDENFDSATSSDPYASAPLSSTSLSSSGWTFVASPSSHMGVVDSTTVTSSGIFMTPELTTGDQAFIFDSLGSPSDFSFQSTDGSEFYLNSVQLESVDATVNVQAYKDGNPVGTQTSIDITTTATYGLSHPLI